MKQEKIEQKIMELERKLDLGKDTDNMGDDEEELALLRAELKGISKGKREKVVFVNCERSVIRTALNLLWNDYIKKKYPASIKEDPMLNKYHTWCRNEEKDKMSDLYWIQKVRAKLNKMEQAMKKEMEK